MSTKTTIRHGEEWHLYREALESDAVYLEIDNIDVDLHAGADYTTVIVRIPLEIANEIGIITKNEQRK